MAEEGDFTAAAAGSTAGELLRRARESQGVRLDALAAALKVAPEKLALLEADRIEELPDTAFARALALAVCRWLQVDPAPVLALLPRAGVGRLEQVSRGLNAPFRDRGGMHHHVDQRSHLANPAVWGPLVMLLAAAAIYFWPPREAAAPADAAVPLAAAPGQAVTQEPAGATPEPAAAPAADAAPVATAPPGDVPGAMAAAASAAALAASASVASASAPLAPASAAAATLAREPAAPASATLAADAAGEALRLHARAESWIEVKDARNQVLLSRSLQAGETVELAGQAPLRVRIGNAAVTEVTYHGRTLDLAPATRNNIASLKLE